jgi:hypothetical protein
MRLLLALFFNLTSCIGATLTCANTTQSAFTTQYNAASDGDTIVIPAGGSAGSPTVWTGVTIDKALTIQGTLSGTNWATFLKNASDYIFKVDVSSDKHIRICYIDFDHDGSFSGSDKSAIYINDDNGSHTTSLHIDHCYFGPSGSKTFGGGAWCWGLIDYCYFKNSDSDIFLTGHDRQQDSGAFASTENDGDFQWTRSKNIGDTNRMVIENNVFRKDTGITADPNEILYGQGAPRAIFRYNWVDATANTGQNTYVIDAHGKFGPGSSGQETSVISYEIYKNTINIHHSWRSMNIRGGSSLVYSNDMTTVSGGSSWQLKDEGISSYGIPETDSGMNSNPTGTGGQWTTNCFQWANTINGSAVSTFDVENPPDSTPYVALNTHYFNRAPQSGDSATVQSGGVLRQLVYPHPMAAEEGGGGTSGGGGSGSSVKAKRQSGRRR